MLYFSKIKLFTIYITIIILSFFAFLNFTDERESYLLPMEAYTRESLSKEKYAAKANILVEKATLVKGILSMECWRGKMG